MHKVRMVVSACLATSLAGLGVTIGAAGPAEAAPVAGAAAVCSSMTSPVYEAVNTGTDLGVLSPSKDEATKAAGATAAAVFSGSTQPATGLVPVHRLDRGLPQDIAYTKSASELSAAGRNGYSDKGIVFYASVQKADCLVAVKRYRKGGKHRLVVAAVAEAALVKGGWTYESIAFYAAPSTTPATPPKPVPVPPKPAPQPPKPAPQPPTAPEPPTTPTTGGTFTFAVMPDTQMEVTKPGDPRMANRANWLVAQKPAFVAQTGDMMNWDTPDHAQFKVAKSAMSILHNNGIGYAVAVGNHDTYGTGVGGSARDPSHSTQLIRDTKTLNSYFSAGDFGNVGGAYESNKIDNVYQTYTAGGVKWMILSLEFCARPGAVTWAKQVVAAHPDYNVIISTHSYENGGGGIDPSNQGYGNTSGQKLFDQLVSQYPNVKMVFSGHVGVAAKHRVDTGVKGNKVFSFLTTMHDPKTNPVRMLTVDVKAGTIKTWVYAPYTNYTWGQYSETVSGLNVVR